ncbi:hypothetical protein [Photorhabdus laumondii]
MSGEQLTADVKRHLTLSSEQGSSRYDKCQYRPVPMSAQVHAAH